MAARQLARLRQQQERLAAPAALPVAPREGCTPEAEESDSSGDDAVAAPRNAFDLLKAEAEEGDAAASEEDDASEPAEPPAARDAAVESSAAKKKKKKKVRPLLRPASCVP